MQSSPFDDEEFEAAMREMGIGHRPGMAAAHMEQIAPLLADEGIDLDSFSGSAAELDAALARASERYNLALLTPTGVHLQGSIAVLRVFVQARAEGDLDRAQRILVSIKPDETDTRPAISHVTGVGVGRLDDWGRAKDTKRIVATVKPQPWNAAAGRVARKLLELAARGRAFAGLGDLINRFGGLAVYEGTAVAVAAVVRAFSLRRKVSVREACDELLGGEDDVALLDVLTPEDDRVLDAFDAWVEEAFPDSAFGDDLVEFFIVILQVARESGIDPHDPAAVRDLLIALADTADATTDGESEANAVLGMLHETMHEYVHFRLQMDRSPADWEAAHELVQSLLPDEPDDPLEDLLDELSAGESGDVDERRAAVAEVLVVSAVPDLLDWIGDGRPATSSGTAKRADIGTVASLLGIDAEGVDRMPRGWARTEKRAVMAMNDIPELAAWWDALAAVGAIDAAPGRLRPGPGAALWRSVEGPALEDAETVVGIFLATSITHHMVTRRSATLAGWDARAAELLADRLIRAVADDDHPTDEVGPDAIFGVRVERDLAELARLGIVRVTPEGVIDVPVGLRLTVLRGVTAASRFFDDEGAEPSS